MSLPTSYRKVDEIVRYLKSKSVPKRNKIAYLKKRNEVAQKALENAFFHYRLAQAAFKKGNRKVAPTYFRPSHFSENVLNNVELTNIFNRFNNRLATRYEKYPTIVRIIKQNQRHAVRNAYGRMLHHDVPMNVIRTIQTLVGNNTSETAMLKANKRIGIQSKVNSARRRKNNQYWGNLLGRTHASPKRILK